MIYTCQRCGTEFQGYPSDRSKFCGLACKRIPDTHYEIRDMGFETPCWLWLGATNGDGYGAREDPRSTSRLVHRQFYERHIGPIPPGLQLDHLCRVKRCCNPSHLEPVTNSVNAWRGARTRLTPVIVREIRASSESVRELARRYGVDQRTIRHARDGTQWTKVQVQAEAVTEEAA